MGFGNLVELIGEPGMGKSRLVEELQAQAPDLLAVTTACAQYEASTPYFAFRGLLRSLLELPQNGAAPDALRERVTELDPELVPWLPLDRAAARRPGRADARRSRSSSRPSGAPACTASSSRCWRSCSRARRCS